MSATTLWLQALPACLALAVLSWVVCTARRNAGLVDIFWSLFFLVACLGYCVTTPDPGPRTAVVLFLVVLWSIRLAAHLAMRNWNAPEDRRYRAIRSRNEPGFAWKSLVIVFGLQGGLAWAISAPLAAAVASPVALGPLDAAGAGLALVGIVVESVADAQLARFQSDPSNASRVMDSGLWRYSRHPNYFGEFCVWWGFFFLALGAGASWTIFSPILMTALLLKVSGVALLERDIGLRRPGYAEYVARTNAFFPGPRRSVP